MSELWVFVEAWSWPISGKCPRVAGLSDAKLVCVQSVITAALSESEGTVSEAICDVHDGFPVEASPDAPGLSAKASSNQA